MRPMPLRVLVFAALVGIFGAAKRRTDFVFEGVGSGVNFTPVDGIAKHDIFAISRNPMYVAMPLFAVGAAVLFDSKWTLSAPILTVLYLQYFVIPVEEKFLAEKFGADYTAYCETTPRWLF